MKETTDKIIHELLSPRKPFVTQGESVHNANILNKAELRPIFIDTSCLLYRFVFAKAKEYCRVAGEDDNIIVHLLCVDLMNDITGACAHFGCAPVMAFDSSYSYRKAEVYPEYKGSRTKARQKKTLEEKRLLSLVPTVVKTMKHTYCTAYKMQYFCVYGYESDDIVAAFVLGLKQRVHKQLPAYDKRVVFATSDHDLYQLLIEGVHVADVRTGVMSDGKRITKTTGISPEQLVASKCLAGCNSDDIPGVPGCGKVSMMEAITKGNSNVKRKLTREALQCFGAQFILRRNFKLIEIPYDGNTALPPLKLSKKVWPLAGVPDKIIPLYESMGIPKEKWPAFGDVTAPRSDSGIEMCQYNKQRKLI